MKKYLSICSIALLIGGCSVRYPSKEHAITACHEWQRRGEVIKFKHVEIDWRTGVERISHPHFYNRKCQYEPTSRQFLGKEGEFTGQDRAEAEKFNNRFEQKEHPITARNFQIVKNFRYIL